MLTDDGGAYLFFNDALLFGEVPLILGTEGEEDS